MILEMTFGLVDKIITTVSSTFSDSKIGARSREFDYHVVKSSKFKIGS